MPQPRRAVEIYEREFGGEGQLISLFGIVKEGQEEPLSAPDIPIRFIGRISSAMTDTEDEAELVAMSPPNGALLKSGEQFTLTWHVRNAGRIAWKGRRLVREGPHSGPGLIRSPPYIGVDDTPPGNIVLISTELVAPENAGTSIAYFAMVEGDNPPEYCYLKGVAFFSITVMVPRTN